jgi:NAD(P)-dependent dehydrogenase (short-subunit alcohol dehydrogenase family)
LSIAIDLSGQVVLVTGGTRGIGHEIVEQALQAGARVAFCAPEADECAARAGDFERRHGDRVMAQAADLRNRGSLDALVEAVMARWGRVDTLVCNAADFGVPSSIDALDCDVYERVLQANVVGNFHLCRIILPGMAARGSGCVIVITSIVGFTTMPTNIPYSSSKAALMSMARSLAADCASKGVRVNCVSPGLIRTDSSRDIWENEALARSYVAEKIPMQRMGVPADIASTCVFLASPMASYITAATIAVDGGRLGVGQPAGTAAQIKPAAGKR